MEIDQARQHVNEVVWYRRTEFSAADSIQVRILSTSTYSVRVTDLLDISQSVPVSEAWDVSPDELHFEKSGFEDL